MLSATGCQCSTETERRQCLIACPNAGEVAGWGTLEDGSHVPIGNVFAQVLWDSAEAAKAKRLADMPTEQDALRQLWAAQERLKELGWQDPIYAPKDGSPLDIIELGSTGVHRGYYEGEWPTGSWWIVDGDIWPSRPALARAAAPDTPSQGHPGKE